jgi:hypothetical protein
MKNNKQQTAVEWLQSIELERDLTLADWKQAKEMEKEQKIRDFTDGYLYRGEQLRPWLIDKWYNETYGGGEQ